METILKDKLTPKELAKEIGWDQVSTLKLDDSFVEENADKVNLYSQFLYGHISPYILKKFAEDLNPYYRAHITRFYPIVLSFIEISGTITDRKIAEDQCKISLQFTCNDCNYIFVIYEEGFVLTVTSMCGREQDTIKMSYEELRDMYMELTTTDAFLQFLKETI